ncbi:MAG: orotidine-5'-phosphate decarboxylase [Firmicutes bacterium]|nr:orotidine-5'-phosphate decarboxylase [Bacillota bacterium]
MAKENAIIVALDVPDWQTAQHLVSELYPVVDFFKIGMELFTAEGPKVVEAVKAMGARVFLDLKYHDIPNTVKGAVAAAARLGVDMMTVHTAGGATMLRTAAEAVAALPQPPILLGVTVLTSIDEEMLSQELKVSARLAEQVIHLAKMAVSSGLQGIVASPLEIGSLRQALGNEAILVTPGIRPAWEKRDDQKRVATPTEALTLGADYLVIGRPITAARDPEAAAISIQQEIAGRGKEV